MAQQEIETITNSPSEQRKKLYDSWQKYIDALDNAYKSNDVNECVAILHFSSIVSPHLKTQMSREEAEAITMHLRQHATVVKEAHGPTAAVYACAIGALLGNLIGGAIQVGPYAMMASQSTTKMYGAIGGTVQGVVGQGGTSFLNIAQTQNQGEIGHLNAAGEIEKQRLHDSQNDRQAQERAAQAAIENLKRTQQLDHETKKGINQ